MKRNFEENDHLIPLNLLNLNQKYKKQLKNIQIIEKNIQLEYNNYKKKIFLLNSLLFHLFLSSNYSNSNHTSNSNSSNNILNNSNINVNNIKNKLLRVYIHHKYYPANSSNNNNNNNNDNNNNNNNNNTNSDNNNNNDNERGYYILTIEGRLLDLALNDNFTFGLFFDSIKVQIDKKYNTEYQTYEWKKEQFLNGKKANCFQFKIYADRSIPIKITLTRSDYACKRYEVGPTLRDLLPYIRTDPTEDEVLTAVWQYIEFNSLYDFSTSRPLIRCDDKLRAIFGGETINLSIVKNKILECLHPCKPISVDYILNPTSSSSSSSSTPTPTPKISPTNHGFNFDSYELNSKTITKAGGRVFDLSVEIVDPIAAAMLSEINHITALEMQIEPILSEIERRTEFIVTSLRHYDDEIERLKEIKNSPYPIDLLSENSTLSLAGIGNVSNRSFVHPIFASVLENESRIGNESKRSRLSSSSSSSTSTLPNETNEITNNIVTPNEFLLSVTDSSKLVGARNLNYQQMKHSLGIAFNGLHTNSLYVDVGNNRVFEPNNSWMEKKTDST